MKLRDAAVLAAAAVIATGILSLKPFDLLDGLSIDSLHWLRSVAFTNPQQLADTPVVVIGIDEETYRRPPFQAVPRVMWTPEISQVVAGVLAAGAKVIGFDVIFPTSVERDIKGFDRKFLIALRRGAIQNKILLGKVQHQEWPISPHRGQSFAVGHQKNIRSVNVFEDDDGVIRRVPLFFEARQVDGSTRVEPSMAVELAGRAGGTLPPQGSEANDGLLLNFAAGDDSIPTYSLADLYHCSVAGRQEFYDRHFAGKVVLIGTTLDVEDRKLTSKRYIAERQGTVTAARCILPEMPHLIRKDVAFDTIPGVYVHATAVNNLLRGDALMPVGPLVGNLVTLVFAVLAGLAALILQPGRGGLVFLGLSVVWIGISTILFQQSAFVPLIDPLAGGAIAFIGLLGFRTAISDRDKRYLRRVFSYYLPPQVIDRMVGQDALPTLGGESKEVTILFSDIADFTSLSEGLAPAAVTAFLNDYLTAMSDIIEEHGGFIEKFVADEITGVFGAPIDDPAHAVNAVSAALMTREKLSEMKGAFGLPADRQLFSRTGINSGEMLVGNIGSRRRFTYAAMGDAANLGSRIEGVNKVYGTDILVGERTRELCEGIFEFREIDTVRVVGRGQTTTLYQPLGRPGDLSNDATAWCEAYAEALKNYRARRFSDAASQFEALANRDPASRVFAERSRAFGKAPPGDDWDAVYDLETK